MVTDREFQRVVSNIPRLDYDPSSSIQANINSGGGTLTSGLATMFIKLFGNLVYVSGTATVTTNGTGVGYIWFSVPYQSAGGATTFSGVDIGNGATITGYLPVAQQIINFFRYDGAYPAYDAFTMYFSGVYERDVNI